MTEEGQHHGREQVINSLFSTTLDLPPSCIEFSKKFPEYFVVGTYNLEKAKDGVAIADDDANEADRDDEAADEAEEGGRAKKSQSRNGSVLLFKVEDEKCILVDTQLYPSAILDLHFSPHNPELFAIASSTGSVSIFSLSEDCKVPKVTHLFTSQITDSETLVLSLAWHPTLPSIIGVTLSDSTVWLLNFDFKASKIAALTDGFNTHDGLEAWTLAFSASNALPGVGSSPAQFAVYSGGDDGRLRSSLFNVPSTFTRNVAEQNDIKEEEQRDDDGEEWLPIPSSPPRGYPGHEAGLVAILPLPLSTSPGQDIMITGSYDDHVRVYATFDHRDNAPNIRPKALAETYIGGGVWRLKFLREYAQPTSGSDQVQYQVLASCMHAGSRVLEIRGSKGGEWTIEVLARLEEHKSMNYGSDVQPVSKQVPCNGSDDGETVLCVSTSFYDRLLCLWKFQRKH